MSNLKGRFAEELGVLNENYQNANKRNVIVHLLIKLAIIPRLNFLVRKTQTAIIHNLQSS